MLPNRRNIFVKLPVDGKTNTIILKKDITLIKCHRKNFARIGCGNIKHLILFYSRGEKPIWNENPFIQKKIKSNFFLK